MAKIYLLDSTIQNIDEITHNISTLNPNHDKILIRKIHTENKDIISKILQKNKKIKKISHFSNSKNTKSSFTHIASKKTHIYHKTNITLSFHSYKNLRQITKFKPIIAFLSPVFNTKTHPNHKPLGLIQTFKLGKEIKKNSQKTQIFLLGGMNQNKFNKIKKLDFNNLFTGYAFIRGF